MPALVVILNRLKEQAKMNPTVLPEYLANAGEPNEEFLVDIAETIHSIIDNVFCHVTHFKKPEETVAIYIADEFVFNALIELKTFINLLVNEYVPGYMIYHIHRTKGEYIGPGVWLRHRDTFSIHYGPKLELLSLAEGS